jgi:hypothetical protein
VDASRLRVKCLLCTGRLLRNLLFELFLFIGSFLLRLSVLLIALTRSLRGRNTVRMNLIACKLAVRFVQYVTKTFISEVSINEVKCCCVKCGEV